LLVWEDGKNSVFYRLLDRFYVGGARSGLDKIKQAQGVEDLYAIFGDLFSPRLLERAEKGTNSRRRQLPPMVTF